MTPNVQVLMLLLSVEEQDKSLVVENNKVKPGFVPSVYIK